MKGKETREIAAEKAGFSSDFTYRQAKAVVEEGIPELVEKMDAGEVSVLRPQLGSVGTADGISRDLLSPDHRSFFRRWRRLLRSADMNDLINLNSVPTMSSREIAELTGKRHDHVLIDIRKMMESLDLHSPDFSGQYVDGSGRSLPCFNLPKRETLILVSGYSVELRARIIDRWQELEGQQQVPRQLTSGSPFHQSFKTGRPPAAHSVRRRAIQNSSRSRR